MFNFPLFPESASTLAPQMDALLAFLLAITAFFSLLIAGLIIFLAVKYRHTAENVDRSNPVNSHLGLELGWTIIPLIITMGIFFWGATLFYRIQTAPADALEMFVIGKQWMWKTQHPEGQREINALHVPVNTPIQLTMISEDVIHNFGLPAFRLKQDVLPGRYTREWFQATKVGAYHIFCDQYCGTLHSQMVGQVVVMEQKDYQRWLSGDLGAPTGGVSMVEAGADNFKRLGCASCHTMTASGRGPSLIGIYNRKVSLTNGQTVVADDNYLRESILKPSAKIVRGYQPLMPAFQAQVSEQNVLELIAYLKSLNADKGSAKP
jgi:cytochrome c oxidase subunit II